MDYNELIEELKTHAFDRDPEIFCTPFECGAFGLCSRAATAIETLLAERDAAVNLLHGACYACINKENHYSKEPCSLCIWGGMRHTVPIAKLQDSWKWWGSQKGGCKSV